MQVKIKILNENAKLPVKAYPSDAGFDLIAVTRKEKDEYIEYGTGLAIEIPEGYAGFIFPRSSISKHCLSLANAVAVFDSGYRGEIILRYYVSNKMWYVPYELGDRIAQIIIMPLPEVELVVAEELTETIRGEGGLGSTGA